jgi:hypothetical protein
VEAAQVNGSRRPTLARAQVGRKVPARTPPAKPKGTLEQQLADQRTEAKRLSVLIEALESGVKDPETTLADVPPMRARIDEMMEARRLAREECGRLERAIWDRDQARHAADLSACREWIADAVAEHYLQLEMAEAALSSLAQIPRPGEAQRAEIESAITHYGQLKARVAGLEFLMGRHKWPAVE